MDRPVSDDSEQARRRHRALADPSRARILAELADDGPLDTRELALRVGLHANTVRVHLGALADAGLVAAAAVAPQGRGRPRLAYSANGEAPDQGGRRYRLLAEILTTLVARSGGDSTAQLEEIGEAWGHHLVESPPPLSSLSDAEAVGRLVELLAQIGFEPELESKPRSRQIAMRPCPFLELARRHQEVVCPIHLGLMRGALAELGATTRATKLEPFVRPDLCVAHLAGAPGQ
jgi:predicted ArsR family transcriptional regulator